MENIKKILSLLNSKLISLLIIIILIIMYANQCHNNNDLKRDNIIKDQNIAAADTVIKYYKNKDGQHTSEKAIWILSEKQLKKENSDLYEKVKNQEGKIISLNNAVISLSQSETLLHDSLKYLHAIISEAENINGNEWKLPWALEYRWDEKNYDYFKGHTIISVDTLNFKVKHLQTLLDNRNSNIELTFGEKVLDGKYNVYVTSKYPGLSVESMKGVLIDPNTNKDIKKLIEKPHWFTGFSFSVGISSGYDLIHGGPSVMVGGTLGYTLYQW